MAIKNDINTIHVFKGGITRKKDIYADKDSVTRLSAMFDRYFPSGSTMTVSWTTEPNNDNRIVISSETTTDLGTECYVAPADYYDHRTVVKAHATNSGGEQASCSFNIYCIPT